MNYKREGKGQALVLVHGFLLGSGSWQPIIELLKDRLDIIVPDLPGFAGSGYFPAKDDIPGMAESVLDLLDELEMNFFLMGHSMGDSIGQEIALEHDSGLDKLIVYASSSDIDQKSIL